MHYVGLDLCHISFDEAEVLYCTQIEQLLMMGFNHQFSFDFLHCFLLLVRSLSDTKLQAFAAIKFRTAPAFQKIALFFNLSIRHQSSVVRNFVFVLNVLNTKRGPQYSKEKFHFVGINKKNVFSACIEEDLNIRIWHDFHCCETVKISSKNFKHSKFKFKSMNKSKLLKF